MNLCCADHVAEVKPKSKSSRKKDIMKTILGVVKSK